MPPQAPKIDLTLPDECPKLNHNPNTTECPLALYTLVNLPSPEDLQQIQSLCEAEFRSEHGPFLEPGCCVRIAPQPRFINGPLRRVIDYHVELRQKGGWDTYYFVVVADEDWRGRGVLLVTLNPWDTIEDTELEVDESGKEVPNGKPAYMRLKASDVGMCAVNLQIANMGWEEYREWKGLPEPDDEAETEEGNGKDDDNDDDDRGESDDSSPEVPPGRPALGVYIPIYVLETVDAEKLIRETLEPEASHSKHDPFEDYVVRCQAQLKPKSSGPGYPNVDFREHLYAQACSLHPVRCRKNHYLHKTLLLVVDSEDPKEDGMILIRLHWDGVTRGRSKETLRKLGAQASTEKQRIPCSVKGIQDWYCNIMQGVRVWKCENPLVAVFPFHDLRMSISMLDDEARKRKDGEERVIIAPNHIKSEGSGQYLTMKWDLDEAVRRFAWFCHENRFRTNFVTTFFICVDSLDAEQDGVLVVKMPWTSMQRFDREHSEKRLLEMGEKARENVETLRVGVKVALGLIEKAWRQRRGDEVGGTEEQRKFFGWRI